METIIKCPGYFDKGNNIFNLLEIKVYARTSNCDFL